MESRYLLLDGEPVGDRLGVVRVGLRLHRHLAGRLVDMQHHQVGDGLFAAKHLLLPADPTVARLAAQLDELRALRHLDTHPNVAGGDKGRVLDDHREAVGLTGSERPFDRLDVEGELTGVDAGNGRRSRHSGSVTDMLLVGIGSSRNAQGDRQGDEQRLDVRGNEHICILADGSAEVKGRL